MRIVPSAAATIPSPTAPSAIPLRDLDAGRFKLHPTAVTWSQRSTRVTTAILNHREGPRPPGPSLAEAVRQIVPPNPLTDVRRAAHWWYHLGRQMFFLTQSFAGFAAHHVSEVVAAASSSSSASSVSTPFERLLEDAEPEVASRLLDGLVAVQQDYDNILAGCYPLPWDMTVPNHRQYNPLFAFGGSLAYLGEWTAITQRRLRKQPEPVWLSSSLYPRYFTNTFHYQTDGWLSERSGALYEFTTESLFSGMQDAMQRTSLIPISEYVREAELGGRGVSELRLLEVAAGTGRFHTFIKDAYPSLPSVISDLSPFYLARARENMRYWRDLRQPGRGLGGVDDTGVTQFLQTAAENIDAADNQFDILVCVYLFHELPEAIRRRAASEFFRVLKPGGLLVVTDSVQLGDRPGLEGGIDVFGDFNEPYYRNYLSFNLGAMFEAAGFVCDTKYISSVTKTLSFRKPLDKS
ncbi:hypothetical protein VOLCADRAFT_103077 [Volvox carteri f. nagariensis]|uniref:Methyltransferase domain-containing protein n=1 Tax=Volvox carteri f. nagariensis TaxID=3068 RepID=D8TJR6_VOLCA|nr:uncharacterized protein VOLCADRAFT_103077 [Volvox carteri f. nagariensis]EFJ52588.1 hypothetical protein VOLCADRAFT_103077 [Volvox carteri f. nagariensis]|eukprot:XP_002946661.1 hypothetical protein VOLCADRAFT_103077 [Volvox carteri f. nagariensis]